MISSQVINSGCFLVGLDALSREAVCSRSGVSDLLFIEKTVIGSRAVVPLPGALAWSIDNTIIKPNAGYGGSIHVSWQSDALRSELCVSNHDAFLRRSRHVRDREAFTNRSNPQLHLILNDPLSKGIAIGTRPISVFFKKWIAAWRWFNDLHE